MPFWHRVQARWRYGLRVNSRFGRIAVRIGGVLVVFALFCASAALGGSWWRFPNMPTAEEWSAFFGASALVALGFAWYQIRQIDQSNKALIVSNEQARQVNLEAIRPRLQVALESNRIVSKNRGAPVAGTLSIAVWNSGVSPARDVRLSVSPPFTSLDQFFNPGMMSEHFEEVNGVFNGDVHFQTLNSGSKYIWFLGRAPELFTAPSSVPRKWRIEATYRGTMSDTPFHDSFVIDLDVERRLELPVDPVVRIGKDLQVLGEHLSAIKRTVPRPLELSDDTIAALHSRQSRVRRRAIRRRTR